MSQLGDPPCEEALHCCRDYDGKEGNTREKRGRYHELVRVTEEPDRVLIAYCTFDDRMNDIGKKNVCDEDLHPYGIVDIMSEILIALNNKNAIQEGT